jgi:hypothetical protein
MKLVLSITSNQEIKITITCNLTVVRIAITEGEREREHKSWQRCGEKGTLVHCW